MMVNCLTAAEMWIYMHYGIIGDFKLTLSVGLYFVEVALPADISSLQCAKQCPDKMARWAATGKPVYEWNRTAPRGHWVGSTFFMLIENLRLRPKA